MRNNIADILKEKRRAMKPKAWTQQQAADAVGVSLRQYQKYERNLMPPWDVLQKIENAFGISITNLQYELIGRNAPIVISQRHLLI